MDDFLVGKQKSFAERRQSIHSATFEEGDLSPTKPLTLNTNTNNAQLHSRLDRIVQSRPRGPPTPNMMTPSADPDSPTHSSHDPPPPPTPAASPGPDHPQPDWKDAGDEEDYFLSKIRSHFKVASSAQRHRILADLLNLCTSQQLSFVRQYVDPLLKKDPFTSLPNEICLRILSCIDDPKVLARASQVSQRWRELLADDVTWMKLCAKHDYGRRMSENHAHTPTAISMRPPLHPIHNQIDEGHTHSFPGAPGPAFSAWHSGNSKSFDSTTAANALRRPKMRSYKSHFKQRYLVETAWRTGGRNIAKHITQDQGVVTSLHLTPKYIVVALDNAKIHVFDTNGTNQKTLQGHVMGVWAMVPWEDTLVSGGCDRDVRVESLHTLRGHTSTVRCLKMSDSSTAISGSRDTTLRIWDIKTGLCKNVLVGHQASVRCLEIKGDIVVSGSYDTTARVWSISEGRCLRTLNGHFSQIYAIAFDGNRVATGSLDTSVRIWDPTNGTCQAILQGHTSLVGQLQMRGNTLVTGGSDGSVRVWSLEKMAPIHRLAAHDNSVTSLQFDDTRVVSGGSDGRVKVWDLKTGCLVRELTAPADAVWRVAFEEEKCVVMASRSGRTIMEVWSFSPPEEVLYEPTPTTPAQRGLLASLASGPPRPLSAIEYKSSGSSSLSNVQGTDHAMGGTVSNDGTRYANSRQMEDVEMEDSGTTSQAQVPNTAPLDGRIGETFFRERDD
ncbi:related to archipelago beta form (F-box-WD40 repeat protein) [Rhynchosporium secalis]|uniref:Mitochondrial division protein 1 n=1 Tax=Rhynchosporium secalis TaxID=38038 RepID=A0A1E1MPU8_RHYSE|nr:related to archipelago beta form (F-box-WD40 repeat protein) [Rhynchosporium secalis]